MDLYRRAFRPLLFRLDAERAHELGKVVLRRRLPWDVIGGSVDPADLRLRTTIAGIEFRNPVGLAAGFDKNSEMLDAFQRLGFGYAIPGSIRGRPADDNPSPKILRYVDQESLINCTGFPSEGAAASAPRLAKFRDGHPALRVIPNITGFTVEEYLVALDAVQPYADAIEISLSCPNERYDEFDFLYPDTFQRLIDALNSRKRVPFMVKIRNFNSPAERDNRLALVERCIAAGVDAVLLPGSHITPEPRLSLGKGNLGGRIVFPKTLDNIRAVAEVSRGMIAIKALGGIAHAEDAFQALAAGASTIELLTALIYEGWRVADRINAGLLKLLADAEIPNVATLVGSGAPLPGVSRERAA
jgi:dihydroorotate dehydrogenase